MVVVVDGLAASGGYIAAMAADHIIALDTSLVGSIGVLFQYPNFTDLLKTIGVNVEEHQVVAAQGRPQRLRADQPGGAGRYRRDRQRLLRLVQGLVKDRRKLDDARACQGVRRPGFHRPASGRPQAGRRAGQREAPR